MVRFSITMDDDLTRRIDQECVVRQISRSDWINEACTRQLRKLSGYGIYPCGQSSPIIDDSPVMQRHNIQNYDETYRNFRIEVPEYFNFGFDVVDAWAKKDRNKIAMVWTNQKGDEKFFTFRDLSKRSNEIVNMMIKYKIGKGDRVLIMLHRVPEWWFMVIALIKTGAVYIPAPTMLTPKDLEYRINASEAKMVITDVENAHKVDEIADICPTLQTKMVVDGTRDGWLSYPRELIYPAPVSSRIINLKGMRKTKSSDPMVIFFSSGTTGEPKMVLHSHDYPLGHIVTARFWHDVRNNDLHFTVSDTGWAKSAWGKLFGQWIEGAAVFVYDYRSKFNATELLPIIEKYGITTFCAPPTIYRMLIMADLRKYDFSELRHCVSAGELINPEVIKAWKDATGLEIYEGYGQTETVLCIGTFPSIEPRYGSMGKPTPGWAIELHDEDGKQVKPGEEGSIAIKINPRPIGFFMEYWDNKEANANSTRDGFYYTGDRAIKDEDGYFWFVGRDDDVIKASGYRIGPFEVESAILEHQAVQEAAVVGSPDIIRGFVVKAFIVLKTDFEPSDKLAKNIQDYVKSITAPYKYPRKIEFVKELPKTISGKIKRKDLRDIEMKKFEEEKKNGNHDHQ
ncbi:AMP-binding protein [Methanospirillum sp.]|uniref:AMP-binding protein n=1 Tax=Methanospirillum sp. TaxID=45200 RepID=UPI0035A14F70